MAAYRTAPATGGAEWVLSGPMNQLPELRKRALSDILEGGAGLAIRHLGLFLRVTTPLLLPVNAVLVALGVWLAQNSEPTALVVGLIVPVAVVSVFLFLLAAGACVKVAADAYPGARPSVRTAIGFVLGRLGSFLLLAAALVVGIGPGIVFLIVFPSTRALGDLGLLVLLLAPLSLWLTGIWSVALPAMFAEQLGALDSLRRSRQLVSGSFWRSFGTVVLGTILALFAGVLVALVVSVFSIGGHNMILAATLIGFALGELFVAPLLATFAIVLYYDLRARREGFRFERAE
jgi:hypothetical protein